MTGNLETPGGAPMSPEELFDHVATLAALTYTQVQDAAALRNEACRVVEAMKAAAEQYQAALRRLAAELQTQYSPDGIAQAIAAGDALIDRLSRAVRGAGQDLQRRVEETAFPFWRRTMGAAIVGLVTVAVAVCAVLWVLQRQDSVSHRIALSRDGEATVHIEHSVRDAQGKAWIPILQQIRVCEPKGSADCAVYGRVN